MLAKCANPTCSTPLVYLREGKIFMVEAPKASKSSEERVAAMPKAANRIEHFWLCGPCSAQMTLAYDRQHGVQVVPKSLLALRAVAS